MIYELKGVTADALYAEACWTFKNRAGPEVETRNGPALSMKDISVIELTYPRCRVLYNPDRDANPFFHMMEAIWMWAGREDLEWIQQFNKGITQFAEEDGYFHGAYGKRWRHTFGADQLKVLADNIRSDPTSRRHVLQMWGAARDLEANAKDIPCNTQIMFRVLKGKLNMTVINRSNDLIWGALGANLVHMTMLQELMALSTGLNLGTYRVVSNDLHVYERHWDLLSKKIQADIAATEAKSALPCRPLHDESIDIKSWLADAQNFCNGETAFSHLWFRDVALPMKRSYMQKRYRERYIERIECPAWRQAATHWNNRRKK